MLSQNSLLSLQIIKSIWQNESVENNNRQIKHFAKCNGNKHAPSKSNQFIRNNGSKLSLFKKKKRQIFLQPELMQDLLSFSHRLGVLVYSAIRRIWRILSTRNCKLQNSNYLRNPLHQKCEKQWVQSSKAQQLWRSVVFLSLWAMIWSQLLKCSEDDDDDVFISSESQHPQHDPWRFSRLNWSPLCRGWVSKS